MIPVIVICRRASDPLLPGSAIGYKCRQCGLELQVSADGRNQIALFGERVQLLCNKCGFEKAKSMKPEDMLGFGLNPAAVKTLEKQGISVEDLIGRKKK